MELTGEGSCNGSFGEILQGVLPGNRKFLINLKIRCASRVRIHVLPSAYSNEKEAQFAESYRRYSKSYKAARNILSDIGRHDDCFLNIDSDIPVGKGLSSSTADMVASIQALASSLSLALKPDYIARMMTEIEPNDGLHHPGTSAYHHTTGELIARYDYVPPLDILGIDMGGTIDTVEFNRKPLTWGEAEMERYAGLLESAKQALADRDIDALCRIATESTQAWQKVNPKRQLESALKFMRDTGGLGIANTHSGTYLGVLYRHGSADMRELLRRAEPIFNGCVARLFETEGCTVASPRPVRT